MQRSVAAWHSQRMFQVSDVHDVVVYACSSSIIRCRSRLSCRYHHSACVILTVSYYIKHDCLLSVEGRLYYYRVVYVCNVFWLAQLWPQPCYFDLDVHADQKLSSWVKAFKIYRPNGAPSGGGFRGRPSRLRPPWATDRRRHRTPDKWKRYCIIASAKFCPFYCKTCTSEYSKWLPPVAFWQL